MQRPRTEREMKSGREKECPGLLQGARPGAAFYWVLGCGVLSMLMAHVRAAGTSRLACRDICDFILTSQCWSLALSVPSDCLIPWTLGILTRPEIFSFWGHPGATSFLTLVAPVQILYATHFSLHHLRAYRVLGTEPSTFTVSHAHHREPTG